MEVVATLLGQNLRGWALCKGFMENFFQGNSDEMGGAGEGRSPSKYQPPWQTQDHDIKAAVQWEPHCGCGHGLNLKSPPKTHSLEYLAV